MKKISKDFKGISWVSPKNLFNRFVLVILFTTVLTLISLGIQVLGSTLFRLLGL